MPLALLLLGLCPLWAHDPITTKITFSREISRLFHARCLGCHKPGGKAPMSLVKYEEARPWAKAIKEEVLERRMPPWGAVKGFGEFRHDQGLTQEEVHVIADWVEGGAPEGDPKYYAEKPLPNPPALAKPKGSQTTLSSAVTLSKPSRVVAIAPKAKSDVASARVVVEHPDGEIAPLLWLKDYKAKYPQVFEPRKTAIYPAGAKLRVEPPGAASFVLFTR